MRINHTKLSKVLYWCALFIGILRILTSLYNLYPYFTITVTGAWPDYIEYYSSLYPDTLSNAFAVIRFELRAIISYIIGIVWGIVLIFSRKNHHWKKCILWGMIWFILEIISYWDIVYHYSLSFSRFPFKPMIYPLFMISYGLYKRYLYKSKGME